ncbi:hypothetical protein ACQPVP_03220 [Clostridium nigeriense]|uniref:hypothetical protein n=1 Tax=Clostridium nigeriense TaxID=1805470 RepID=UPI003D3428CA
MSKLIYFFYVVKIFFMSLLKLCYEVVIGLLIITILMFFISFILNDKYYFTKKLGQLKRYMCRR